MSDNRPSIDKERLNVLRDALGEGDFAEVVAAFTQSISTILEEMSKALADEDMEALERQAHSAKSASANLGAMALSAQAREMEELARRGELEFSEVPARIAAMRQAFERARAELDAI